jgi:hypothetical protein
MNAARLLLGGFVALAANYPGRSVAEEVSEEQPIERWSVLGMITGFHSVRHKKSGFEIRLLEADGSASVAQDPISLFLVVTNNGTSDLTQRVWRMPRGVARVRGMVAVACGAEINVDVDVIRDDGSVPGSRPTTLRLCFLSPKLALLPSVTVTELKPKKAG